MNKLVKYQIIAVVIVVCVTGFTKTVRADDAVAAPTNAPAITTPAMDPKEDKWTFNSPLFFWLAGLDGTATGRGRTVDVNLSPSDIANHMDIGFTGYFELEKGKVGIYCMPVYMQLSASGKSGNLKADLTLGLTIIEFGAYYKIWDHKGERPAFIAAVAGGRYWDLHNELTVKDPLGKVNATQSTSLFDPILGLRWEQYVTDKFHIFSQADIGGFDMSESQSRFTWDVTAAVGYDFTMMVIKKPSTVFVGYRVLSLEYYTGTGASQKGINARLEGVILGLNVQLF